MNPMDPTHGSHPRGALLLPSHREGILGYFLGHLPTGKDFWDHFPGMAPQSPEPETAPSAALGEGQGTPQIPKSPLFQPHQTWSHCPRADPTPDPPNLGLELPKGTRSSWRGAGATGAEPMDLTTPKKNPKWKRRGEKHPGKGENTSPREKTPGKGKCWELGNP